MNPAAPDHEMIERIRALAHAKSPLPPPSNLSGFPTLPTPGTGVVVSDDDLLASLHRDGHTLDHAGPPLPHQSTPMEIAIAWAVGLTAGAVLSIVAFAAVVGVLKLAGMV